MRKVLLAIVAVLFVSVSVDPAGACGDKLLAMSRSIALYKAYAPWRIASILIYQVRGNSPLKDKQFQSSLKQAGHKVQVLNSADQLSSVLNGGKYDLVLAEISDADSLKDQLSSIRSGPSLLPILNKPTKNELAAAEKQYRVVIKVPAVFTEHLEAIDRMMKIRAHAV